CPGDNYTMITGTATIVPGRVEIGTYQNWTVQLTLPFSYTLYDRTFSSVEVWPSRGMLQFVHGLSSAERCLPVPVHSYTIYPYWVADLHATTGVGWRLSHRNVQCNCQEHRHTYHYSDPCGYCYAHQYPDRHPYKHSNRHDSPCYRDNRSHNHSRGRHHQYPDP